MDVDHSPLLIDFIYFWFETRLDGMHRYDTSIDFLRREWYVTHAHDTRPLLLRGQYDASLSDEEIVRFVRSQVDHALATGRL